MAPPDMVDGRIPVMLYNFGGSILNLVTAAAFLCLAPAFEKGSLMSLFCFLAAGIGLVFSLVNGIPMQMGLIDNDGRNAFTLYKDPKSLKGFWIQLKVSDMQSKGIRLKDMPGGWFEVPSEEDMKNSINKEKTAAKILKNFDLAELRSFEQAKDLTIDLLKKWLVKYKFKNWAKHDNGKDVTYKEKEDRASIIAKHLSDNNKWKSHGRPINIEALKELKLEIEDYSENNELRILIRDYYETMSDYMKLKNFPIFIHDRIFL